MKRNTIVLSTLAAVTLLSVTANALNIEKAVELALVNNNILKEQVFKIKEYDENINGAKTAYNPTFDVNYSYDAKNNERSSQTKHD